MPRPPLSPAVRPVNPVPKKDVKVRDGRTVLGRVNVNASATASATLQKRIARPSPTINNLKAKHPVPRPAVVADVFGDPKPQLGKRARADVPALPAKRSRADPSAVKAFRHEQEKWTAKWQAAFPTLTFHFELGAEEGQGRGLRERAIKLGARIDQFFSRRITHLIVKNVQSPQKPRAAAMKRGQSDNPFIQQGPTDLRSKAEEYGIKVWTVKKLSEMLDTLDPINIVERGSLSHMLADERLHGTRERDESAPRPDHYYFRPGSKYVLIEDGTGKNRTIMVKEYSAKEQDWPVLHEQFLRLTSSCALPRSIKSTDHLHRDLRARAMALYVNHEHYNGEEPPAPSLKRSASEREFSVPALPEPEELPYVKASGNSVVLTSNIASTSTNNTNHTPGGVLVQHQAGGRRGAMQVSKRVEVLKRNLPPSRTTGAVKRPDALPRLPGIGRRKSTADLPSSFSAKEFMSQAEVVTMLHGIRNPTTLAKPSYDERLANRELVEAGQKRKEQDTASGYCENCRIRYADLSVHMASRKHRRFALNAANFADLDEMLHCLQRPPNPIMCVQTKVCRPCHRAHTKDAQCGRCMDDADLYSSPPPSEASPRSKHHLFYVREDVSELVESEDDEGMNEDETEEANDEAAEAADRG
ncbi:uncharacterized protein CcaverHIS019_0604360 [Cutaneotrichosporon cavernicola]|uniref:DBF4-type domain-containing protein n=1 Tax=Cutaneotrichosporon cavernicola TaxID=279322 RepID=A0AA48QY14_9TREE|nr:uncharacterized protein CcaverHIS019_0604360 [Cutaneotrichosporon cavernicola]BEI93977.1 hypothetical protein CcaverHIS019_0604360 [Cutaneotrichosporon cavernicola]BEJ01758.1 hypothetical protein CcaverHIS631_0604400 [Cutaneotrichosporon cavernicola]